MLTNEPWPFLENGIIIFSQRKAGKEETMPQVYTFQPSSWFLKWQQPIVKKGKSHKTTKNLNNESSFPWFTDLPFEVLRELHRRKAFTQCIHLSFILVRFIFHSVHKVKLLGKGTGNLPYKLILKGLCSVPRSIAVAWRRWHWILPFAESWEVNVLYLLVTTRKFFLFFSRESKGACKRVHLL